MLNIDDRLLDESITPEQLYLLCHVAKHMGQDLTCFPSNKTLCLSTKWGLTKLKEVKRSLQVDGFLRSTERYDQNRQLTNIYTVTTPFISVWVNLKGKGDETNTSVANATHTGRHSDPPPVANATTEVLTNEVLNLHYLPASEKLKIWADDVYIKPETKKAYTRGRGLKIENFESDFQKWRAEAEASPEQYTVRADVVKHFLNYACQEQKQKTYTGSARQPYAAAKKSHRPEINENYAPPEKQLW